MGVEKTRFSQVAPEWSHGEGGGWGEEGRVSLTERCPRHPEAKSGGRAAQGQARMGRGQDWGRAEDQHGLGAGAGRARRQARLRVTAQGCGGGEMRLLALATAVLLAWAPALGKHHRWVAAAGWPAGSGWLGLGARGSGLGARGSGLRAQGSGLARRQGSLQASPSLCELAAGSVLS